MELEKLYFFYLKWRWLPLWNILISKLGPTSIKSDVMVNEVLANIFSVVEGIKFISYQLLKSISSSVLFIKRLVLKMAAIPEIFRALGTILKSLRKKALGAREMKMRETTWTTPD